MFGYVRVVWNDSLALCRQSEKKPKSAQLQKLVITQAKKTEERAWLSEVSNIPLQQSIADLETAFKNFFESCKGKRKGRKVGYPKFKKRINSQSARLTRGGFSIKGEGVYLAKIGIVKPIWSRELPSKPSSATIIKDCANRYFLSFVVEIEPVQADAENQSVYQERSERVTELSQLKKQFMLKASHELRTPLNHIIGYLQLTVDDMADDPIEERAFIQEAHRSALHLSKVIGNVLDFIQLSDACQTHADLSAARLKEESSNL